MTDQKAAQASDEPPIAWLISWYESAFPCSMVTVDDPNPADPDEIITPLYPHPSPREARLEALLKRWNNRYPLMHEGGCDPIDGSSHCLLCQTRAELEAKP